MKGYFKSKNSLKRDRRKFVQILFIDISMRISKSIFS